MTYHEHADRTYEQQRRDAATDQGLDPATEALTAAGVNSHIEQTGGFIMVLVVPGADVIIAVTHVGDSIDEPSYAVVTYTRHAWFEGDEPLSTTQVDSLDALVDAVRALRATFEAEES